MTHDNILDYPDTDAIFPDDRGHSLVLWLSLDSLDLFWREAFDGLEPVLPTIRQAARAALEARHRATQHPVASDFLKKLADVPDAQAAATELLQRDARIEASTSQSLWLSFLRQYAGAPEDEYGIPDPAMAVGLRDDLRSEVIDRVGEVMATLRAAIAEQPLSDWDMVQHTRYGENFHETGRNDRSSMLTALKQMATDHLFNTFLITRVLHLPANAQEGLLAAIRAEWADTYAQPHWNPAVQPDPPKPTAEDLEAARQQAARILPAAEIVVR